MNSRRRFLQVFYVVGNATNARPIRVAWRDAQGSQEVPLGALHRIVARDPPLGLALLRGLHGWEIACVVSGVWVSSRHFRPTEWAPMKEVGYAGVGGVRRRGRACEGVGSASRRRRGRGGASTTTAPNPPPKPSRITTPPNPPPRMESFLSSRPTRVTTGPSPGPKGPNLPPPPPPRGLQRPSPPPNPPTPPRPPLQTPPTTPKTHTPKGDEKKDNRSEDPIIGTVVHVPYPTRVERGTVRGIHGQKYGAVRVEYPGGATLYEVARPHLFPTLEEAERHREEARGGGKKKAKPLATTNEASNPPNANPTTEPTNPSNPTNPTSPPSGPAKTWDPITGSHEV